MRLIPVQWMLTALVCAGCADPPAPRLFAPDVGQEVTFTGDALAVELTGELPG